MHAGVGVPRGEDLVDGLLEGGLFFGVRVGPELDVAGLPRVIDDREAEEVFAPALAGEVIAFEVEKDVAR